MEKIKFEMDQNMAALVVGSFANMIGSILNQYKGDAFEYIDGEAVLIMPHGGHLKVEELQQVVVHKVQIMANLSTAFKVPEWMDMAYRCQQKAIDMRILPEPEAPEGSQSPVTPEAPPTEKGGDHDKV